MDEFANDYFFTDGDWVQDVNDLYTKFEVFQTVEKLTPAQLHEYLDFRLKMLEEELTETRKAFNEKDADGVVDGIIDLCVFAIGTLDVFNVDAQEAWDRVHMANMQKEIGVKANRTNAFGFHDLVKPPGWVGPTHEDNVGLLPKAFE